MSWQELDALGHKIEALEHADAILSADEATHMPTGGGQKRAEAVATLAAMTHELASAPEIAHLIAAAHETDLTTDQRLALGELGRTYRNLTCLPADFVRRKTEVNMRTEQAWRTQRAQNDWAGFAKNLEEVVELAREEAFLRADGLGLAPYDALMEQFDPGNRTADVTPLFDSLKAFLSGFLPEAIEAQNRRLKDRPRQPLANNYPVENQRRLGLAIMEKVGFDFEHGRLDQSHHPFCGGVPSDVRMTTRYETKNFLPALMGVLHETGHALYEQGLPKSWSNWPLGKARGMAIHESQSLFMEMQLARTPEFWEWALPLVREHLGTDAMSAWTAGDILAHANHVEAGFIRVYADEVTYPLHIILRYEIEQALIVGDLKVADIPEAWNAKMIENLGLSTLDNPKDGPMQDVHWSIGAFGYFPSYTLGAMTAAQLWGGRRKSSAELARRYSPGEI